MRIALIFPLLILSLLSFGQDISYTQSFDSPLNLNPALTGYFPCKFRVGGNYKNRFPALGNVYKTQTLWFDSKLQIPKFRRLWYGAGFRFNNDIAGGVIRNTSGMAVFSFNHGLVSKNRLYYTVGFGIGYQAHRLKYEGLVFDNQWNGQEFDPELPSQENSLGTSNGFIDICAGLLATYEADKGNKVFIGFAMHHANSPNESFTGSDSRLAPKMVGHMGFDIEGKDDIRYSPRIAFMMKQNQMDLNMGMNVSIIGDNGSIIFGVWSKMFREFTPVIGVEYKKWVVKVSYDFVTGTISNHVTGLAGGIEMSVAKTFKCTKRIAPSGARNKKIEPKIWGNKNSGVSCPTFK